MNVILLAVCALFVLLKQSQADYKKILSDLSVEDALSLMNALGVDQNITQALNSLIPTVMSGEQNFFSLLKSLMPLITSLSSTYATKQQDAYVSQNDNVSSDNDTLAVDEFASDEIKQSLSDFFS